MITNNVDQICVIEYLLDSAQQFIVWFEMIAIIRCKDHLLIPEGFLIEILHFLQSISIKPQTAKYRHRQYPDTASIEGVKYLYQPITFQWASTLTGAV